MFSVGVYGVLARRNVLEFSCRWNFFNAVGINFVAFNRYLHPDAVWGQGVTLFVIALAAAEAVVGLALVLTVYRETKTVMVERLNLLKG